MDYRVALKSVSKHHDVIYIYKTIHAFVYSLIQIYMIVHRVSIENTE